MFLKNWRVAEVVRTGLYKGQQLGQYALHAWVIMPNHVHVLLTPRIHPTRLINLLKGATAREANKILRRTGEPFWQGECYDHWVRDEEEFARIARYIANNPVRAGLAGAPADYPWSDCYERADESARGGEESARHR